jgi:hypothetical protein
VPSTRLLTLGPANEPLWVRRYVPEIGEAWAAMLVGGDVPAPGPRGLKGMAIFAATANEAKEAAKAYLGRSEPMN